MGKSDIRSTGILKSELSVDKYSGALTEKFTPRVGTSSSALDGVDGYWSDNFIKSDVGKKIIGNIASSLMPVGITTTPDLNVEFTEDNYHTRCSIYGFDGEIESDKKLVAFVKAPSGGEVAKFDLSEISIDGNRFEFGNRAAGVYDITVMKVPRSFDISG